MLSASPDPPGSAVDEPHCGPRRWNEAEAALKPAQWDGPGAIFGMTRPTVVPARDRSARRSRHQRRLIAAAETDPQRYGNLYSAGWPDSPPPRAPQLNRRRVGGRGPPPLAQRPGAGDVIAHFASCEAIVRYEPAPPMAGTTGDIEALSMWAGQSVALVDDHALAVTALTSPAAFADG
jgi:hypothetical protein